MLMNLLDEEENNTIGGLGNSLSFGGLTLTTKSEVRSLGIHLNPALTMETQVASLVCSVYFHLWRIVRLRPFLDVRAPTTLVHVLVNHTISPKKLACLDLVIGMLSSEYF